LNYVLIIDLTEIMSVYCYFINASKHILHQLEFYSGLSRSFCDHLED